MAQTFTAAFQGVTFVNNKPMAAVINAHASEIFKIRKVVVTNPQTSGVTGVVNQLDLRVYTTAPTFTTTVAGTLIEHDSSNTLPTSGTYQSATSISGGALAGSIARVFWSSDEPAVSVATVDELQNYVPLNTLYEWQPHSDVQPITLRQNECILLFNVTVGTPAGTMDVYITFTKE
jgi:hypothetical protein